MTVQMLIERLQECDPDTQVLIIDKDGWAHEYIMINEFNNNEEAFYSVEISFQ